MNKTVFYIINFVVLLFLSSCAGTKYGSEMTTPAVPLDRSVQPEAGTPPNLALPAIQNFSLSNGLKVKLVEHHELPVVEIRLLLNSGAFVDPKGKAGTADFTADMLDEGTTTQNAFEIADAKDFIGARLNSGSGWDGSFVTISTLKKHLNASL